MMKALYILSLVVSLIFGVIIIRFHEDVLRMRTSIWLSNDNSIYSYESVQATTVTASMVALVFIAAYLLLFSFSLRYLSRTTAKVISIIGLSISGLTFLLTLLPITRPTHISYDEFAPVHFIYIVIMVAFGIVNLVQAIRNNAGKENDFILDDLR